MDGRKPSISPTVPCDHVDAEAAATDSVRENSTVTFSGSAEQISEGFAIALRAMGFEAGIPPSDAVQSDANPNPEDR